MITAMVNARVPNWSTLSSSWSGLKSAGRSEVAGGHEPEPTAIDDLQCSGLQLGGHKQQSV